MLNTKRNKCLQGWKIGRMQKWYRVKSDVISESKFLVFSYQFLVYKQRMRVTMTKE